MEYRGLVLDHFQSEAIRHINEGHSVLVSAPTGTGKTLIADYLIEHILADGGEVIYTAPVKALSNQKFRQYSELYGRDKVGLITGDLVINRDAPIRIMTTEILRNILLEGHIDADPDLMGIAALETQEWSDTPSPSDIVLPDLARLKAVIIDEIHFLDDPERGTVWEELLIYLPHEIRILGLSATLSNLHEFAGWLSAIRKSDVKVVRENKRTIPLELKLASTDTHLVRLETYQKDFARWKREQKKTKNNSPNSRRGRRGRSRGGRNARRNEQKNTTHLDVMEMLASTSFPVLYFIYSRKMVEVFAAKLAFSRVGKKIGQSANRAEIDAKLKQFQEKFPDVLIPKLQTMYQQGVAFHHAGMHVALKALVEELYEARLLKILYCTSTFAMGINMPARTVIFDGLTKFNGTDVVPLTVREFMQMAGRAGRRGIDDFGHIVIRQDFSDFGEVQPLLKQLMSNKSEPVRSSFNLSFHSVANLLARFEEAEIRHILEQSFMAYQSTRQAQSLRAKIERKESIFTLGDAVDKNARERRKERRELASLQRQLAEEERPRLWDAFQRKVSLLRRYGYIDSQNELQAAAKILRHIKIEEIFVTELIMNGVFEDRTPAELFGIMCGLVQTLPRSARVRRPDAEKWWAIFDAITAIYGNDIVTDAEVLAGTETIFTPELMPLGERWATGDSLADILEDLQNPTDLSGDIVGAFRRAKDLVGQLRHVYYADEPRRRELSQLLRDVTRDEVEVLD